jgi:hypothetical protein
MHVQITHYSPDTGLTSLDVDTAQFPGFYVDTNIVVKSTLLHLRLEFNYD